MADLERSRGRRLSRSQRSDRAYKLTLATGALAVASVVTFVLALVSSFSWGIVFLLVVLTVLSGLWLRRTLGM